MLETVSLEPRTVADYRSIVGDDAIAELQGMASTLQGKRMLHVNATAYGGGVAEILTTMVPLLRDLGIEAEWQVIQGADEFFEVTKACHNGLQGMPIPFTEEMQAIWQRYNERNAELLEGDYDTVVIHDPQPAGLLHYRGRQPNEHWTWRCHIDTSRPNPEYWEFFAPYIAEYQSAIFTMPQYVGPGISFQHLFIMAPTIDPLTPKNMPVPADAARGVAARFGLDSHRPIITQVSRYDPWKDPIGVIDAYRLVKRELPEVQLVLIGSMATDDPEGWQYYERTVAHAGDDPDIHILQNLAAEEVAAFQSVSAVVIQKSLREGFGLTVSEALWKGRPVVGGDAGGIPLQVIDGENGFLVDSVEACAEKTLYLLRHPDEADAMGARGREHVRGNFLVTRGIRDHLRLMLEVETAR